MGSSETGGVRNPRESRIPDAGATIDGVRSEERTIVVPAAGLATHGGRALATSEGSGPRSEFGARIATAYRFDYAGDRLAARDDPRSGLNSAPNHVTQHELQDAAVAVVVGLSGGVDAD